MGVEALWAGGSELAIQGVVTARCYLQRRFLYTVSINSFGFSSFGFFFQKQRIVSCLAERTSSPSLKDLICHQGASINITEI